MKEHYVSYDQAVKLKDLGFDWPCTAHFSSDGSQLWAKHQEVINSEEFESPAAPRLDQTAAWLREVRSVEIVVEPRFCNYKRIGYDWFVHDDSSNDYALRAPLPFSDTYELALSAGIDASLELLTNKQTDK